MLKIFVLVAFILMTVNANGISNRAMRFNMSLPRDTQNFMKTYGCRPRFLTKKENQGFERWSYVNLLCSNLRHNTIRVVNCDGCVDPVSCKTQKDLKSVAHFRYLTIRTRDNMIKQIQFPVACKCLPVAENGVQILPCSSLQE